MRVSALLLVALLVMAPVLQSTAIAPPRPFQDFAFASGGGHYLVAGVLDVQFAFVAVQHQDGSISGQFHHHTNDGLGNVEFFATVTCLAVDVTQGRAWIGGRITENLSTSPDFMGGVYDPGHDIWFRVLDSGSGDAKENRTTFMGFEGAIPSSAAYCASQPWAPGNARTWPVTAGNINVR